jgi:hypothetical protein
MDENKKIILVEQSSHDYKETIEEKLKEAGVPVGTVWFTTDPKEAIKLLPESGPCLILTGHEFDREHLTGEDVKKEAKKKNTDVQIFPINMDHSHVIIDEISRFFEENKENKENKKNGEEKKHENNGIKVDNKRFSITRFFGMK